VSTADPTPARISIYEAAAGNRWRTVFLIAIFAALVAVLAYFVGEYFAPGGGIAALPFALALSCGVALLSYFAGDRLILAQSQARELGPSEEPQLRNVVETLAIGLGIPAPKIYVIAHELSHVGNRDIRVMVLVVVLVGTVALLADWMWRSMFWGRGRDRDRGGAGAIIAVIAIALAVLTPIIATLIQLAVSRQREYLADASGALLTRYPPGLVSALRKIAADKEPLEVANKATAALYIANPLKDAPAFFDHLFDTHPPIEERIKRLEAM